ncbi:MAG: alpha/beta hydrolase [Alphaproteobacteria bacterium]
MTRFPQQTHLLGPSYGPYNSGRPDSLVILLHGYGASGDDLIRLVDFWGPHLPSTLFIAPNAPFPCETNPFGYQWFGLQDFDGDRIWQEIEILVPFLGELLQSLMTEHALSWDQVAFAGFSQGSMLALAVTLSFFPACGALCYSGMFPPAFQKHIKYKTPICLIHGDRDEVVPLNYFHEAQASLIKSGLDLESLVCQGLGHSISPFGLEKGAAFLMCSFAKKEKNIPIERCLV